MKTHLSGIIPIANYDSDINVAMPPFLLPVTNGFSAIQKSVFECAMAGCDTIWIVANDDLAPITRKLVGDWIYDPVYYKRDMASKFYSELRKEIPIYYVAINPKDRDRRDSYGWSVLHGIHTAYMTSLRISKWLTPEKYFISFPFGVYNFEILRKYRKQIRERNNNFFLKHENNYIKDNVPLACTMTGEDFKLCRRAINKKTTREYLPPLPNQLYPTRKLPPSERWSARNFNFKDIFENINETGATYHNAEWHYDISTWNGYRQYLKSENQLKKPIDGLTKPHKHVKIPYDSEG
mgnify:CR=1 FL=1|tara:strand:- start:331 stop:1212 length:882 start_codon:yes stop_codon:yes gene_type:complete